MNKRMVNIFLILYLMVIWPGVIFRIDRFSITWVPMYSVYQPSETISKSVRDKAAIRKGFRVTHRNGSISDMSAKDLNMLKPNFRQFYGAIIFGHDPPKHKQGNTALGTVNR